MSTAEPLGIGHAVSLRRTLFILGALNLALLISYLAAVSGLVHDERVIREKAAVVAQLEESHENLSARFFGNELLDQLRASASSLGLVPIGKRAYMSVPQFQPFRQASGASATQRLSFEE